MSAIRAAATRSAAGERAGHAGRRASSRAGRGQQQQCALQLLAAILLFVPVWQTFTETGLVEKVPTAILCVGLVITSLLTGVCGVILDAISRQALASKKLAYLNAGLLRR